MYIHRINHLIVSLIFYLTESSILKRESGVLVWVQSLQTLFDGMYMNHPGNNHDEWHEVNHTKKTPKRMSVPIEQGIVKTQLEIVEVENPHYVLTYEVCIFY